MTDQPSLPMKLPLSGPVLVAIGPAEEIRWGARDLTSLF